MVSRHLAGAVVMSALLLVYLGFALVYASILLRDDNVLVRLMGIALCVLPLLGAWGLVTEWIFGARSARVRAELGSRGLEPTEFLTTPSGRTIREHAEGAFPTFAQDVRDNPESWTHWARLAIAYDACADRRRARWAMRKAIALFREA